MAAIYSTQQQYDAITAANAAVDGEKEATFLSVWQTALGNGPTLNLYRDSTKVWSATTSGLLPISGSAFVIPTSVTEVLVSDADIDTGDWEFRIENAGDATIYYGADVSKAGGTDILALSDDLDDEAVLVIGEIAFYAPELDTETQTISRNDSRVVMWMDPNYTFKDQLHGYLLQVRDNTNNTTVWSLDEPGLIGTGSTYTLSRVSSPYSDGMAFLHRIDPTFPLWAGTQRSQYLMPTKLTDAVTYWLATEFSVESSWASSGSSFTYGDVHHNSWTVGPYGVLPGVNAPINFGGTSSLRHNIYVYGNYTPGSGGKTAVTVYTSDVLSAGDRVRLVVKFRVTRSWADGPFIQAWHQINSGSETMIVDRSDVMIGYADMLANECYVKPGLYSWSASDAARTMYTKGMIVMRDAGGVPTITAAEMFNLVRSL